MIYIERKLKIIASNTVMVHPRIITPLFFIKLKSFEVVFKEWRQPYIWLPLLWYPICHKLPEGYYQYFGQWERSKNNKTQRYYLEELEVIRKSYSSIGKTR